MIMRVAIMQPYFFPYLGHFGLIASVDEWIVFDVTQYTPRSWINRNRVLHPKVGWNHVSVPLSNSSISIEIHQARILDAASARTSVLGKLSHYRRAAPHYGSVVSIVEEAFANPTDDSLVHLNVRGLEAVCRRLEIPFRFRILSELGLELPDNPGAGGWAPIVCERLGAASYVNPAGGRALFDPADFARRGVELLFAETEPLSYATGPFKFEPALSILDVLMWNAPEKIAAWLREHTRLTLGE
jgi:hypothetical protein